MNYLPGLEYSMSLAIKLIKEIDELLSDLGKIPEPVFAYHHVQSDVAKRLDLVRKDRVNKRRKRKKKK